ncbi:MAG: CRISPR-associated endonuclease Cas2 [Desulfobacula sp.]|nr:CRISPR-associated endonuclease Cas2 [Desulfobacula sp.]
MIFYDIENNRTRKKVADKLIEYGYERLQLSVFAGNEHPKRISGLWEILVKLVGGKETGSDKLYALRIEGSSFKKMLSVGNIDFDIAYICGERHTMIC